MPDRVNETAGDKTRQPASGGVDPRVSRINGISFLEVPSTDLQTSANFYRNVFGWSVSARPSTMAFEDGTAHVIGHFTTQRPTSREAGTHSYVYVERLDDTLRKVSQAGGSVAKQPYPEGDLWVATFRDPSGNIVGVWQQGPR